MPLVALVTLLLSVTPAAHAADPHPAASPTPATSPAELFSRRALRQARLLIQMRVMQLRDERLECVRQALLRRLPSELWPELPTPSRGTPDAATAAALCDRLLNI